MSGSAVQRRDEEGSSAHRLSGLAIQDRAPRTWHGGCLEDIQDRGTDPEGGQMTKKHFEAFARQIQMSDVLPEIKEYAALVIVHVAEKDNPRFDRDRFLKACGL